MPAGSGSRWKLVAVVAGMRGTVAATFAAPSQHRCAPRSLGPRAAPRGRFAGDGKGPGRRNQPETRRPGAAWGASALSLAAPHGVGACVVDGDFHGDRP